MFKLLYTTLFITSVSLQAHATVFKKDVNRWHGVVEKDTDSEVAVSPASSPQTGVTLCPDNTYVKGNQCTLCPNGQYVGGATCTLGPDGHYY